MTRFIILVLILISTLVAPLMAISTTVIEGESSGSLIYSHCVSMETSGGDMPRFGVNQSPDYTYDGSQTSVLTNGYTKFTKKSTVDQTDSNYYVSTGSLATDYMGLAEDTAGMINIQGNEPENMCDAANMLNGEGTSGQYPISESYEGRVGVVFHDGGVYESEVGLNDGDIHLSGAADIWNKGYLYQDKRITSKKGFDKNSTALNLATSETEHTYVGTSTALGKDEEVHKRITSDYTSIEPAFDEVLAIEEAVEPMSISEGRINETEVNSTIEVTSNLTEVELPTESPGLADVSNQSIVRE